MNPYSVYTVYNYFPFVVPVLIFVYFVYLEKKKGATVGKALMYLQVVSYNGYQITWAQSIVRNLTKLYWFPIIFDLAIGIVLKRNDRIFSAFTKTVVIDELNY